MALIIIYFKIALHSSLPELLFSSLFFLVILEIALWNSIEKLLANCGYEKKSHWKCIIWDKNNQIHTSLYAFIQHSVAHTLFHRNSPSQWFLLLFTAWFYLKKVWYPREKACESIIFSEVEHSKGILLHYILSCLKWNRSIIFLTLSVQETCTFPWKAYFVTLSYSTSHKFWDRARVGMSFRHQSLQLLHISCPAVGALHEAHGRDSVWGKTTF